MQASAFLREFISKGICNKVHKRDTIGSNSFATLRLICFLSLFCLIGSGQSLAVVGTPSVSLALDASIYARGSALQLSIAATAGVPPVTADVYVALRLPDGSLFFMRPDGSFSVNITPRFSNIAVPDLPSTPLFHYRFTGGELAGRYICYAALAEPGTHNIIGAIASANFMFYPVLPGANPPPIPPPVLPTLSVANASVVEGNAGTSSLNFTVTLSAASAGAVTVNYATTDGTALAASDYTATAATLSIAAGATSGTITVMVGADTLFEPNETLTLTLTSPANATLATAVATGTIFNDDAGGLNDTGITKWGNGTVNNLTVTQAFFPVQDADKGRDANPALNSNADGKAGFSFTKLDAAGQPLTNQAAVYGTTPWSCVLDQVTGLMWEVKTPTGTGGLRAANWTYTWYNSTGVNDGGNAGTASGGTCVDGVAGAGCDTEKYVAAVNAAGLCGFTDWRLPRVGELYSIVDQGIASPGPTVDTGYFPNTIGGWYWSASPYAGTATSAWVVFFDFGNDLVSNKSNINYVRLVRGGQ